MIGIYDITLTNGADNEASEVVMETKIFPGYVVGRQTRGGNMTAQ